MTNITEYMVGKEFFKWDAFAKEYLTNEERKMPIRYYGEYFNFFCKSADLLDGPVEITCSQPNYQFVNYIQGLSNFWFYTIWFGLFACVFLLVVKFFKIYNGFRKKYRIEVLLHVIM